MFPGYLVEFNLGSESLLPNRHINGGNSLTNCGNNWVNTPKRLSGLSGADMSEEKYEVSEV